MYLVTAQMFSSFAQWLPVPWLNLDIVKALDFLQKLPLS
jgi:hypothetical protein